MVPYTSVNSPEAKEACKHGYIRLYVCSVPSRTQKWIGVPSAAPVLRWAPVIVLELRAHGGC